MLEFVDSDLNFVQDKNNFINPLLQVGSGSGSGSGSVEKSTGSGSSSLSKTLNILFFLLQSGINHLLAACPILVGLWKLDNINQGYILCKKLLKALKLDLFWVIHFKNIYWGKNESQGW